MKAGGGEGPEKKDVKKPHTNSGSNLYCKPAWSERLLDKRDTTLVVECCTWSQVLGVENIG